jgi:hypothetical protein
MIQHRIKLFKLKYTTINSTVLYADIVIKTSMYLGYRARWTNEYEKRGSFRLVSSQVRDKRPSLNNVF